MCLALSIGRKATGFEHQPATARGARCSDSEKVSRNFAYEREPPSTGRAVLSPNREGGSRRVDNAGRNYSSLASVTVTSSPDSVSSTGGVPSTA